jgi:hypothetical protein
MNAKRMAYTQDELDAAIHAVRVEEAEVRAAIEADAYGLRLARAIAWLLVGILVGYVLVP